jgi:hypothetical protein
MPRFKVTILDSMGGIDPSLLMLMKMNPLMPLLHFYAEAGEDLACPGVDDAEADGCGEPPSPDPHAAAEGANCNYEF